jgi:hypothetical protein
VGRQRQLKRQIRREFTLGEGAAEYDALLREAFYETWIYKAVASRTDQRCFLVGRTGSGKSACFRRLEDEHGEHLIRLSPEDLSLTYITELQVVQYLKSLDVQLDPLFVALWKHVLIIEIIKHRYHVDSMEAKLRFFGGLMEKVRRDRSKVEALRYLEDFEGKFWQETDERVREVIERFESQVKAEAGGRLGVAPASFSVSDGNSASRSDEQRTELVRRFQRLVNQTQLPRLNKMERVLNEDILDSHQHYTYIVIDDLDRDWADEKLTNDLIRCLFRAVIDLKRVENLKIVVALRTNIFEALDFGRSGGQEEKFRDLVLPVRWSRHELKELLDSRVAVAAEHYELNDVGTITDLLPRSNSARDPLSYILRRTLQRPRDAIAFLNECFHLASGKEKLTWDTIHLAEVTYSKNRLLALRDEWKPTFPGIEKMLHVFSRVPSILDWEQMAKVLNECALQLVEHDSRGPLWAACMTKPIWSASSTDDPAETYKPLIDLLYKIGFIGCLFSGEGTGHTQWQSVDDFALYNYDDSSFADNVRNLPSVTGFRVHPAFRPYLEIKD